MPTDHQGLGNAAWVIQLRRSGEIANRPLSFGYEIENYINYINGQIRLRAASG